jgi:predicted dehydrogenase
VEAIRLGVVGCGVIGKRHLEAAEACDVVKTVAVADRVEGKAQAAAQQFGVETIYAEGEEVLADARVDAVVLATPTCERSALALKALEAGKHTLVEKPVAMCAADVEGMIAAAGDLTAGCCSSRYQFAPHTETATEFVASGALGKLRVVHCRAHQPARKAPENPPPAWRLSKSLNGGGILVNWGCYDLDYLLSVTGWSLEPKTVLAQTWQVSPRLRSHVAEGSDAETHFAAFILCEDGEVISFERGEYMPAHEQSAWQIIGTNGSLNLTMTPQQGKVITHDDTTDADGVVSRTIWEGNEDWGSPHKGPVRDFAEAIIEKRQPTTDLHKSLLIQRISDAIYESARLGRAVDLS